MSGVRALRPRPGGRRGGKASEQLAAARHGARVGPDPERAPRRVVGGDEQQAAVVAHDRRRARVAQAWAMRCWLADAISVRSATDTVGLVVIVTSPAAACSAAIGSRLPGAPGPGPGWAWRWSTPASRRRWPRRRWRTRGCGAGPSRRAGRGTGRRRRRPCPEAVDDTTGNGGTSTRSPRVAARTPLGPCLTTAISTPRSSSAVGGPLRVGLAHRDLALLTVAHGDSHVLEGLADLGAGLVGVRPEHRPVVEVEDGVLSAPADLPGREVGAAARLLGQARDSRPEDAGCSMASRGSSSASIIRSGCDRVPVEVQGEVVGREDLAERHRGWRPVDLGDEGGVDAEAGGLGPHVAAEGVPAGAGDQRGAAPVPGRGDRDVGGAAAEELLERLHVLQAHAVLEGVDVDPGAPHGDQVVCRGAGLRRHLRPPRRSAARPHRAGSTGSCARRPPGPRPPAPPQGWCPAPRRTTRHTVVLEGVDDRGDVDVALTEGHVHPPGHGLV